MYHSIYGHSVRDKDLMSNLKQRDWWCAIRKVTVVSNIQMCHGDVKAL